MNKVPSLPAVVLACIVTGCTSGNSAITPTATGPNPLTNNKLQFVVGTANIGSTAGPNIIGLNVVATYRQPNGFSGTQVNSPMISGPTGFTVPPVTAPPDATGAEAPLGAGNDAGTSHLSSNPQAAPVTSPNKNTFGGSGGLFSYGFAPLNTSNNGPSGYSTYTMPFFDATGGADSVLTVGGPPAYLGPQPHPNIHDGTYPTGFVGYSQGFLDMEAAPVVGTYTLSLGIPLGGNISTISTTATLSTATPLGAMAVPVFANTSGGGATVTVAIPAGVTETIVNVLDGSRKSCHKGTLAAPPYAYSAIDRTPGPSTVTLTFPNNVGPIDPAGTQEPTFCSGDALTVTAYGFDYPAFEAGPPNNASQTPTITGTTGQADLTSSAPQSVTY